jgi:hypothetical protein
MLQGIAMINSLRKYDQESTLVILALDDKIENFLHNLDLQNTTIVKLSEIENAFPELLSAKGNRSKVEYYFTLTPAIIKYSRKFSKIHTELSVYLDADLFFFNHPDLVLKDMLGDSVGIFPHRFNKKIEKKMSKFGVYNVGMVIFKHDEDGIRVLEWWYQSCIAWCHDYVENNKFADQKYLEYFENYSSKVKVFDNLGANLAPWNIENTEIKRSKRILLVNNQKLIFFHFHNLKIFRNLLLIPHVLYRASLTTDVINNIYEPYKRELIILASKFNLPLNLSLNIFKRDLNIYRKFLKSLIVFYIILNKNYIRIEKVNLK